MKPIQQRIYDGNRAREILDNEVFQAVWSEFEQELIKQWQHSPARDADGRERIWAYLQQLQKLKQAIRTTLETGQLAMKDLEHKSYLERVRAGMSSLMP